MIHWFRKNKSYPQFYKNYLDCIRDNGFSKDIVSMDMETSGLNPKSADILSYGSVYIINEKILPKTEVHLFFNGAKVNEDAIVIHELFANTTQNVVSDYLPLILEQIGNRTILGHYVEFDIALINQQLRLANLPKLKNPRLDTLKMALQKDGIVDLQFASREDYTLYALCKRYDITIDFTHDALADAYLTALLYLHLK